MSTDIKLRIHNIISKATLRYGRELWTRNIKDSKKREAAKMRVLIPLLGLTRWHKQGNAGIKINLNQDSIVDDISNYQYN